MRWLILLCIIALISCSGKDSVPSGIIAIQPMQKIMWDMLQADELAMQNRLSDTTVNLKNESFRMYDQVFAIHKVSREQFYKSYSYYQKNPELYKTLVTGVRNIAGKERKAALAPSVQR